MNQAKRVLVWLSRAHRCRGFGIQSPSDYAFVRYVINERWSYYAYQELPSADWLTRKLGRLYFRLANWRQPTAMVADSYADCWKAGCRRLQLTERVGEIELQRIEIEEAGDWKETILPRCNSRSVLVVEGIYRNKALWHEMANDRQVGTVFDLYYCGIMFFDIHRYKHYYTINF